jgi:hypothetical protein
MSISLPPAHPINPLLPTTPIRHLPFPTPSPLFQVALQHGVSERMVSRAEQLLHALRVRGKAERDKPLSLPSPTAAESSGGSSGSPASSSSEEDEEGERGAAAGGNDGEWVAAEAIASSSDGEGEASGSSIKPRPLSEAIEVMKQALQESSALGGGGFAPASSSSSAGNGPELELHVLRAAQKPPSSHYDRSLLYLVR